MENNDKKITIIDENGVEKEFLILFTYHSEEFEKDYVIFYEENNVEELYACSYKEESNHATGGHCNITHQCSNPWSK